METACTVCNQKITGKFCSNCGQLFTNKTATTWSLFLDFFNNIFSVDKSFFGTTKKLLANPKFIVENFWKGNKRYYLSPGSYILYGITIIAIHSLSFGSDLWGITFMSGGIPLQYVLPISLIPFLTLFSYLTFIRQGNYLSKHIISISYISTVFLIIFILLDDILFYVYPNLQGNIPMLLFFISTFFLNSFVFSKKRNIGYHILNTLVQLLIFIGFCFLLYTLFQGDTTLQ